MAEGKDSSPIVVSENESRSDGLYVMFEYGLIEKNVFIIIPSLIV